MKFKYGLKSVLVIIVMVGMSTFLIWAFIQGRKEFALEQERERPIKAASRVSTQEGESVVTLDKSTQIKNGIFAASLNPISHQQEIRAYGMVLDLQNFIDLNNTYASAKANVEKTGAALDASRREYERLKTLHRDNRNISDKTLQAAEAAWLSDKANALAAKDALHAVEASVHQQWGGVLARWLFESSHPLKRLMQQKDVLIQITLPAGTYLGSVPQNALVQTANSKVVSAKLVSPSPRTDPRIQGMSFFYVASIQPVLLPGMNVIVYLPVGSKTGGVVVPDSAVIWWQGKSWVYLERDDNSFVRREIPTDNPVRDGWFVSNEFSPKDRIVVRGAQLLLSEELRSQIQTGEEEGE